MRIADLDVGLDVDQSGFRRSISNALKSAPSRIDIDLEANGSGFVSGAKDAGKKGGKAAKVAFVAGIGSLVAAGSVAAAGFMKGVNQALENEKVGDRFAASTGLTPQQAAKYGKAASTSYRNAWGANLDEVSKSAQSALEAGLLLPTSSRKTIESTQQLLLDTASILEEDVGAAANAAGQLIRTGMAKNAEEAFDIIVKGQQMGINSSDDLLDTLKEYGTQFRALGLDGPEALGLLSKGLQGGARDADTVADSLKEFAIRGKDMSKTSIAAYKALGFNAQKMSRKVAAGGDEAQEALGDVLERLRNVEDPAERSALAVELFGTKAEDLQGALFGLDPAVDTLEDVEGAAQDASDTLNDNFLTALEGIKRQVKGTFVDTIERIAMPVLDKFKRILGRQGVQNAIKNVGDAIADAFSGIQLSTKDLKPRQVADFFNNIADAIPGIAEWFRDDFVPAFSDFISTAKDVGVGVGSGAWTLIEALGSALQSMPESWRDDIVKIGALLAVISKLKPVGNIFGGLTNLFGKGGLFSNTKLMNVQAAVVNVNGAGGGGGTPVPGGGKGGGASKFGKFGRLLPLVGSTGLVVGATTAAFLAPFVAIPALAQRDPNLGEKNREARDEADRGKLEIIATVEEKAKNGTPLEKYLAGIPEVGFEAAVTPNINKKAFTEEINGLKVELGRAFSSGDFSRAAEIQENIDALKLQRRAVKLMGDDNLTAEQSLSKLATQFNRTAEKAYDQVEATKGSGAAAEEVGPRYFQQRRDLIELGERLGLTREQSKKLTDQILLTPKERKVKFTEEGADATQLEVDQLKVKLDALNLVRANPKISIGVAESVVRQDRALENRQGMGGAGAARVHTEFGIGGLDIEINRANAKIEEISRDLKTRYAPNPTDGVGQGSAAPFRKGGELFPGSHNVYTFAGHNPSWAWDVNTATGTPIYAPWAGFLSNADKGATSYGKYLNLSGGGRMLRVAHLSRHVAGGYKSAGQLIGYTGYSGGVRPAGPAGAHAHVETYINGRPINPSNVLRYDVGGILPHGGGAVNMSRKPEAILTNEQWKTLREVARGLSGGKAKGDGPIKKLRKELEKLNKSVSKWNERRGSIKESFLSGSGLAMGVGSATTVGDVINRQSGVLSKYKTFTSNLAKLKRMGVSPAIRLELIEAGPDTGSAMAALLVSATSDEVRRLNSTQGSLMGYANTGATALAANTLGDRRGDVKRRQRVQAMLKRRRGKKATIKSGREAMRELRSADINIGSINIKNEADVKKLIQRLNHLQRSRGKK